MQNRLGTMACLLTLALTVSAGSAEADKILTYNKRTISSHVIQVNGQAYVLVSDAAKLVKGHAVPTADGYVIFKDAPASSAPAGADTLQGTMNQLLNEDGDGYGQSNRRQPRRP